MEAYAQSLIHIDVGNSILARPNLGYEYRWKNSAIGGNLRWQRNALIMITEFPDLMKTSGFNFDLTFKNYHKKHFFTEIGTRLTSFSAPDVQYGWHIVSLYNSKRKFEPYMKIGLNTNRNKRIQMDFGIGLGGEFSTKSLEIETNQFLVKGLEISPDEEILKYFQKPSGRTFNLSYHAQMRIYCRIGKNSD